MKFAILTAMLAVTLSGCTFYFPVTEPEPDLPKASTQTVLLWENDSTPEALKALTDAGWRLGGTYKDPWRTDTLIVLVKEK